MNSKQFLFIAIVFLAFFYQSHGWIYGEPENWANNSHYCGGKSQSPIDLRFDISQFNPQLRSLHLEEQQSHDAAILVNNGQTAQINMNNHFHLKHIKPLAEDYILEQIHFHWGDDDTVNGSEHLLEDRSYPLEMHIVTYSSLYKNIGAAVSNTHGLAVIGVFFEVTNMTNVLLEPLIEGLKKVLHKNDSIPVRKDFDVIKLIGSDRLRRYFRYDGSLTTPPCYESVIWTLLHDTIHISQEQLNVFRSLHNEHKEALLNNFRPIQPLGSRKLFRSFTVEHLEDEAKRKVSEGKNDGPMLVAKIQILLIAKALLMVVLA